MLSNFLKSYLYLSDYTRLCVALRTLPDAPGSAGQTLLQLHRSQRFALETEPVSDAEPDQVVPEAAFLLGGKHLTCPLPWAEGGSLLPLPDCLEILSDLLLPPATNAATLSIKLVSLTCFLRIHCASHLAEATLLLRALLEHHAPTLNAVCITVCPAALPRTLGRVRVRDTESASENILAPSNRRLVRVPSSYATPKADAPNPLSLDQLELPALQSLQLGVPIAVDSCKIPKCSSLHLSYLNEDVIGLWSNDIAQDQNYLDRHARAIKTLLGACAVTLQNLTITGAVRYRSHSDLFDAPIYLPALTSVNLGWTTAAELESLAAALHGQANVPVKTLLLTPPSLHTAISLASTVAQVPVSVSAALTSLPPRLPALRHLVFNGPLRTGLSDRHLAIYATVLPRGLQEELHLQYGILNVTLEALLSFRRALRAYCHCALFRHPASLLHKVVARRSLRRTACGRGGLDFPTRYSSLKLEDVFRYEYVSPDVISRPARKYSRFEGSCGEDWSADWAIQPPDVGASMRGKDLFALEFWQLPQLLTERGGVEAETVYELWDRALTPAMRELYDQELVAQYVRQRDAHFPFNEHPPWWQRARRSKVLLRVREDSGRAKIL